MVRCVSSGLLSAALLVSCSSRVAKAPPATAPDEPVAKVAPQVDAATLARPLVTPSTEPDAGDSAAPAAGDISQASDDELIDVKILMPELLLDIRYASNRNFVGEVIYPVARCLLRAPVAAALVRVQERLQRAGYQLLLWDCYRPFSVQEQFWQRMPDHRYVAKPVRKNGLPFAGSKHNRGAAVDISLADAQGNVLAMPSDHDDFSERAHRNSDQVPPRARANSRMLDEAMSAEGFEGLPTEWWHFDYRGWQDYALLDQPFVD